MGDKAHLPLRTLEVPESTFPALFAATGRHRMRLCPWGPLLQALNHNLVS